jgi:predicted Zn-dependent protease with MMP-like domain
MDRQQFERIVEEEFERLPTLFRERLENVRIVVEDQPTSRHAHHRATLLGLYEGIPLNRRGSDYGVYPVIPDTITLFQDNIESVSADDAEARRQIRTTLIHEIGHYYGMSEADIRRAGY